MEINNPAACKCQCHAHGPRARVFLNNESFDKMIVALRKAKRVWLSRKKKGHI